MKCCDYLVDYLNFIGVNHLFGVGGANIEDVYDSAYHHSSSIQAILAKQEFCAACMADGYSRYSQQLGVVMATSGGGSLNLTPGLGESLMSNQPILAIVGMPPSQLEGLGAFQDASGLNGSLDGEKLFQALASKYFHRFHDNSRFQYHLHQAVSKALSSPFGTSVLMIPKDIQAAQLPIDEVYHLKEPTIQRLEASRVSSDIADLLRNSNLKTMLLLGKGAYNANAIEKSIELSKLLNAKMAVSPVGKANIADTEPNYLGVSGVAGHKSVMIEAQQSDIIIIIGSRLPLMSRVGLEEQLKTKKIIYIHEIEPSFDYGDNSDNWYFNLGDINTTLIGLVNELSLPPNNYFETSCFPPSPESPLFFDKEHREFNFENIFRCINNFLHPNDIVFADAGNTGGAAIHYVKPTTYFGIALGMGGMGYAIGASIGSCFNTQKVTYCFVGDGAMLMHGMEIHTAIEYELPIRFIIFNNNSHAMCFAREKLYYQGLYSYNLFKSSHFGNGFKAMFPSLYSEEINSLDELEQHLKELTHYTKPAVLSLNVSPHEVPPFLPFTQLMET